MDDEVHLHNVVFLIILMVKIVLNKLREDLTTIINVTGREASQKSLESNCSRTSGSIRYPLQLSLLTQKFFATSIINSYKANPPR